MTERDLVFSRLAELDAPALDPALGARLRERAHARLRPRPLAPAWSVAVAASVVVYLGWALDQVARIAGH